MSWGGHAAEMQLLQTEDRSTIPRGNPDIGMRYVSGEKNLRAIFVKMIESELKKDQIEQSLSQKENTAQSQTFSQTFWTELTQKRFALCHRAQYNPNNKTLTLTRRLLFVNHIDKGRLNISVSLHNRYNPSWYTQDFSVDLSIRGSCLVLSALTQTPN